MQFNFLAFFLISLLPLIIGAYWYHPKSFISQYTGQTFINSRTLTILQVILLYILSVSLVFGYVNLVVHQMGFYELFFTDIMMGNKESEQIVVDFLHKYGEKHRHLGHGVFHGVITALMFALPFVVMHQILEQKSKKYLIHHLSYWFVMSAIVGGCIAEFI